MNEFEDGFSFYLSSEPTGNVDEEGREIRTIGQPILAWNGCKNNLSVVDKYRTHSLVRERYFYTLPSDVIDAVVAELGESRFDADSLVMERELSNVCGDHSCNVGFWQDVAIPYRELRTFPVAQFPKQSLLRVGIEPARLKHSLNVYQERDITPSERASRGFCGWLMTNRQFLDEHDVLLSAHKEVVQRWGTHQAATFLPDEYRAQLLPGTDPNSDPSWPAFVNDCKHFLIRWRLSGLAGPYLPIPLRPLMAGTFPTSTAQHLMQCGGVFFLPDTMPVPSRDQMRGQLEDALHRGEKPDHLNEWHEIVRSDNMAKNRMDPFIRYFELQHFWKILHERHATAIHRQVGKLEEAFGKILGVSSHKIHTDMIAIRKRLDTGSLVRPWPLDATVTDTKKPR